MQKILDLASGIRLKWEAYSSFVSEKYGSIIHVQRIHRLFLIWSVDLDRKDFTQCIKVWDIGLSQKIPNVIRRIEHSLDKYSEVYLNYCKQKSPPQTKDSKIVVPCSWTPQHDVVWYKNSHELRNSDVVKLSDIASREDISVLSKFYDLSANIARLLLSESCAIELPFVMSPEEELIVRTHRSMFILGRSGTGKTTVLLHRMYFELEALKLSNLRVLELSNLRQLLITMNPILCKAIKKSYQSMTQGASLVTNESEGNNLLTLEDDDEILNPSILMKEDLPPLIITYKSFLLLLNDSLTSSFFSIYRGQEVTFERYSNRYYVHCSEGIRVKFDANFIFTEVVSCIKGSLKSLQSPRGSLSKDEYLSLADTRTSILASSQRAMIYSEYEKYESMKNQNFDYDILDLVHYVYRNMTSSPARFPPFHSVFVDEVQDLTPAQIALFKFVCDNRNGFVFAGDTAQTIAPGVGFRFESVKDVFYKEIFPSNGSDGVPQFYHLKQNFRTHESVVNLANSVVELLVEFFPYGIDKLDPEFSLIEGPLPIILSSADDVVESIFANSGKNKELECGFGAEQVILVRDESMKEKVKEIVKDKSLVLTALESKGMEFTDCLIYNFFSSSSVGNDWRALYQYIDPDQPHPDFDNHLHSSICSELKLLYVLLTRARRNLVIYDDKSPQSIPIFRMWIQRNLIEIRDYDENIRNIFIKFSTPEEWSHRGRIFMDQRQFSHARMCFHNSGDHFLEKLCEAGEIEQKADKIFVSKQQEALKLYKIAAELYLGLPNQELRAAKCFESCKEYREAAKLYFQCQKFSSAASCYLECGDFVQAIEAYLKCSNYQEALVCCKRMGYFEKSIQILNDFADVIGKDNYEKMKNEWLYKGAIYYNSKGNKTKASEFVASFGSAAEQRKFYERYQYMDQLCDLSLSEGRFKEVALLHEHRFSFLQAADYYEKGELYSDACRCLLKIIRPRFLNSGYSYDYDPSRLVTCEEALNRLEKVLIAYQHLCPDCHYFLEAKFLFHLKNRDTNFEILDAPHSAWTPVKFRLDLYKYSNFSSQILLDEFLPVFQSEIAKLLSICQKLMVRNSLKLFGKDEFALCRQLFEYFELTLDHTSVNPIHAKYLLAVKNNLQAFDSIFFNPQEGLVASLPSSDCYQVRFGKFAQFARNYFVTQYFDWCDRLSSPLLSKFQECSQLSEQYSTGLFLNSIFAKNDIFDESILSKKKQQERNTMRRRINEFFLDLLVDTPVTSRNYELILDIRRNNQHLDLLINRIEELSVDCNHREDLVRALLYSDFSNTQRQVTERLINSESQSIFSASKYMNLVHSYQWQNEKPRDGEPSSLPSDWIHGEFLYSIDIGVRAVGEELWSYSISQAAWEGNKKITCMSPRSFLELVEKYYVWLQLFSKRFFNVIFPATLLRNTICRKTTGYANAVRFAQSRQQLRDTSHFCNISLSNLIKSLLDTVRQLDQKIFERWMTASNSNSPNLVDSFYSFTTRIMIILLNCVLNMKKDNRYRENTFKQIKSKCRQRLVNFHPSLRATFNNFEIGLQKLPKACVSFFETVDSPLECFDIRPHTCENPQPIWNMSIRGRNIIIVDVENCVRVVAPEPLSSMASDSEGVDVNEDNFDDMNIDLNLELALQSDQQSSIAIPSSSTSRELKPLKRIFKQCRKYLQFRNQPIGLRWKSQEKAFLGNGIDIDSPQFHFYLHSICPLVELLTTYRDECEAEIQKLSNGSTSYEDAEQADLLHYKLQEIDEFLERLLQGQDCLPYLQTKQLKASHVQELLTIGKNYLPSKYQEALE